METRVELLILLTVSLAVGLGILIFINKRPDKREVTMAFLGGMVAMLWLRELLGWIV